MISYAAWWILNIGAQNERWDIKRLAEVLKSFKNLILKALLMALRVF